MNHLNRLPQVPATMGLSRLIVKPVRHRPPGLRPTLAGRERDISILSVLLGVLLGLLLVAVSLYGIFLGMSQREYDAVPALSPVGRAIGPIDTDVTPASTTWKERLRALLSPGFRLADRQLLTSALATALPGFLRTGSEPSMVQAEAQAQQPIGGRSIWGWLAALTGIDVHSPGSVLSYTLPGFRAVRDQHTPAPVRSVDLPSRGGSSTVMSVWGGSTVGAGGEWPLPEALPAQFVGTPASSVAPGAPTHDPSRSSPGGGTTDTPDMPVDDGRTSGAKVTDSARSGSGGGGAGSAGGGGNNQPLVLIYHTHTAESYHEKGRESEKDHYEWNSADSGVIQVGKEITAALRAAGIPAVHSVRVNDFPAFSSSYTNSRQLVRDYLEQYPSIVVALDIHRDGTEYTPDTTRINGRQTARIAFIVGSDTSVLPNPHWRKNLAFAQQLHKALQEVHPDLSRGIMLRGDARFNQDLLPNLLVVEVGTYTNELAEAKEAGRVLGRVLAEILKRE